MEEEEGFEPPALSRDGFQDRCLKPLSHPSVPVIIGEKHLFGNELGDPS